MNYTPNYRLPQWVDTDRVLMQDFNAAMANIETGITEAKAERTYAVGSYTGTGGDVVINLGFRPQFVIICGHKEAGAISYEEPVVFAFSATAGNVLPRRISLTDTGFTACGGGSYPNFSFNGRVYDYIAFK